MDGSLYSPMDGNSLAESKERLSKTHRRVAPSKPGLQTGYEPSELAKIQIEKTPKIFGTLPDDGPALQLAKSFSKSGMLAKHYSFWGLRIPPNDPDTGYQIAAPACALLVHNYPILVFPLFLPQGDVTWHTDVSGLHRTDNVTGQKVGEPLQATFRMRSSHKYFFLPRLEKLGNYFCESDAVMLPTEEGVGNIKKEEPLTDLDLVTLPDLLLLLKLCSPFTPNSPVNKTLFRFFLLLCQPQHP